MENAKIIFVNGEEIIAEVNGSCFIVDEKPTFPEDFSVVTIEDENGQRIIENAQLVECASIDGRYWFSFMEVTADEQLRADADYLLCLAE